MAAQHLDPEGVQTREDFGRELTVLRTTAGLTVRDLARQLDAPAATLGDYFAGRHLPGTRQLPLYRALLKACGVSDPKLVERWVAALTRVRLSVDGRAAKGAAPYRGLDAFGEADADLFFGRRAAVDELLARLRLLRDSSSTASGALAVVGPSGSGKTSLFLAGLLPAVRAGALDGERARWEALAITPDQLSIPRAGTPPADPDKPRLVIVDQMEAAFTLPPDQRSAFVAWLEDLQQESLVVVGLRADFYQAAVAEPALLPALRNQVILGPMTADELHEAIVGPIREVGAGIEEGLVDLILADLAPRSSAGFAHEPGALPLLSYALLATWERATRNHLAIADYRTVGGLRGAVRQAAEEVYQDLDDPARDQARRMFGRLVRLDHDGRATRRRAEREELITDRGAAGGDQAVVERFITARLLTADAESVQISHEALLTAWPRLGEWLSSDRDWLRVHHQIADATHTWSEADRDESLLWRGPRLEAALELAADPDRGGDLNRSEREFLASSAGHREEQERIRRRRTRRTHQLLGAVAVLATVALVLAAVAVNADLGAEHARDQALSRQMAVEAQQLQPTDPSLATQLALAAYRISPTVQASSTLVDATAGEIPARILGPIGPEFVSSSGDGRLLAVAQSAADRVVIYRLSGSHAVRIGVVTAGPVAGEDFAVALSQNGKLLAAGGTTHTVLLWDIANPSRPSLLATLGGLGGTIYSLDFAADGLRLAAADSDGTVHQWTLDSSGHPVGRMTLSVPGEDAVKAVAYSPDGTWLAEAGENGSLVVWKRGDPIPIVAPGTGSADFESVDFEPDGTELAVGIGNDHTVEIWDLAGNGRLEIARPPFVAATSDVTSTVYSPNGSILAEAAGDGTLRLYDTRTWTTIATLGDPDPITSLTFAAGGRSLVSADSGGVTRIWPIPPPTTYTEPGNVFSLDYTGNGRYLIAGSAGPGGDVTIWDDANPLRPTRLVDVAMPVDFGPAAGAAALSPNGHLLAVGNATAKIQLFNLANVEHPTPIGPLLTAGKPYIEQLGFSPDGKLLVSGNDGGHVRMWDVTDPADPHAFPTIQNSAGEVIGFSFSPDGDLIATASSDTKVRIYDISHPAHVRRLATVGGFASYAYDTAITPDGHTLIAGSADGTVRMWNISDPSRPRLLGAPLSIPTGYVYALAVSPDGRTLAAASTAQAVWLWNIADPSQPQLLGTLTAAQHEVFAVQFDPAGHVLAASGSDNTLHLWDYQPRDAARMVCAAAGSAITRSEWNRYVQGVGYQPPCR